jgi:hypothetical protein
MNMATQSTGKQMVIKIDVRTGELISVTDENGIPAAEYRPDPQNPLPLKGVLGGGGATILHTQSSPDCVWYEWNGTWYMICD